MGARVQASLSAVLWAALLLLLPLAPSLASADEKPRSTNYEKQALSVNYPEQEEGLPAFGTLNGTVTELDTISPNIILNKTDATLDCGSGFMNIKLKFKQPFFGIVYADYDRNSACKVAGNGKLEETILLPLKGCGTLQKPARVFTNNIVVRFHHGLEIDGDEVITVVCRYPPPIVPPPIIPESLQLPIEETVQTLQPLREFEILLIICAIIFLSLMLLGIGCSYYCLKKRNIKVVRRRPQSMIGSDVTKISEPVSMFDGLKIPRAHAVDASGSEEMTESVRTDFHSDIASVESEEEYTSAYSDKLCVLQEGAVISGLQEPPVPGFDISMLVKGGKTVFTPAMSTASSESGGTMLNAQEQYLTTILERTETNTLETLERVRNLKAREDKAVPVHARLNIRNKPMSDAGAASDTDTTMSEYSEMFSEQEMEIEARQMKNYSIIQEEAEEQLDRDYDDVDRALERANIVDVTTVREDETTVVDDTTTTTRVVRRPTHVSTNVVSHVSGATSASGLSASDAARHVTTSTFTTVREGANVDDQTFTTSTTRHVSGGAMMQHQQQQPLNNFDVLFRIVSTRDEPGTTDNDDLSSIFTVDERRAIRQVIEEDVNVRTELQRSTVNASELQLVISGNDRLRRVVQPASKWDVLIRVLESNNEPEWLRRRLSVAATDDTESVVSGYNATGVVTHGAGAGSGMMVSRQQHQGGYTMYRTDDGASSLGGRSSARLSTADRSGTEIYEFHHYEASSSNAQQQQQQWRS